MAVPDAGNRRVRRKAPPPRKPPKRKVVTLADVDRELRKVKRGDGPKVDTGPLLKPAERRRVPQRKTVKEGRLRLADPKAYERKYGKSPPNIARDKAAQARRNAKLTAPVLDVLEETTRPLHAVAGAVDAAQRGKDPIKAAVRGARNQDKVTFSKVLKNAGAPKAIQGPLGFALDVAADPTTYVTLGTGTVARKGIQAGAANSLKGATVKFAGKEVPGVRRATGETVGRLARRTGQAKPARAVKRLARDVNPNMAPEGVVKADWQDATNAARRARATTAETRRRAESKAVAVRKVVGNEDRRVVDAVERDAVSALPPKLRPAGRALQREYETIDDARKAVGIPGGTRRNYVPHYTKQSLTDRAPSEARGSVGKRVIRPESSKARTREGTLAEKAAKYPGEYNEDAALALANRLASGGRAVAQAELNRRIARIGRPVRAGEDLKLADGEQVFRHVGSDLTAVTDKVMLKRIAEKGGDEYVVLPSKLVEHAHAVSRGSSAKSTAGKAYDRVQGGFKAVATATPGFHIRNLIGDTQNAYLAAPGHRLPGNVVRSGKTLRALKRSEEADRTLGAVPKPVRGGVKVDGRKVSYEELADEAAKVGAIRSGYQNRELHDLLVDDRGIKKVRDRGRVVRSTKRALQSREDLPRLATYIEARRQGMPPEKAAEFEMRYHFDYANLTEFERKIARRAMPFYTFSSRNIPLQLKTLLSKPGKYANYEKLREEAAIAAGLEPGWEGDLTPWEQRNAPIPVRIKGRLYSVSMGLPLTDLNEFPTTVDVLKLASEYMNKGSSLITPLLKNPVEIWANYSFFFRDQIRRENAPLVPAPSFVGEFPESWKKKLGVAKIRDKRSGKMVWGWDAYANYAAHMVPGLPAQAVGYASPSDRMGRGTGEKVLGTLGIKAAPVDGVSTSISDAYDEMTKLRTRLGALSQQGIVGAKANAERRELNRRIKVLERQVYKASKARGDTTLPSSGGPSRKIRTIDDDLDSLVDDSVLDDIDALLSDLE